jgi:predicted Zn-dependent peptidase
LFSNIDCYISGSLDPGLFIIEGRPSEGVSLEKAEEAIWKELDDLKNNFDNGQELQKVKNKAEASLIFSEVNVLNKAINLAFFELIGDASIINREVEMYRNVTVEDIQRLARTIFTPENSSKLFYRAAPSPTPEYTLNN